jgi:hypothetical protein
VLSIFKPARLIFAIALMTSATLTLFAFATLSTAAIATAMPSLSLVKAAFCLSFSILICCLIVLTFASAYFNNSSLVFFLYVP